MERAFIVKGHGYETGSMGRCTAFDGFDIIAALAPPTASLMGRTS
jgi:hypothetical protein